jgi:hypothetical protein
MDTVDIRATAVNLHGTASGSPDEASGRASAYVEQLRRDEYFSGIFEKEIKQDVRREPTSGQLMFDLTLTFKGAVTKK